MEMIPITSASPSNEEEGIRRLWLPIFDPESRFITNWSRFLFMIGIFNIGTDLLFLFIKSVEGSTLRIDLGLANLAVSLRMMGDSCQILGIIFKFSTAFEDALNRVFRKRELVKDPKIIAKRYLKFNFIIDVVATFPMPEVYLWTNLPYLQKLSTSLHKIDDYVDNLVTIVYVQFLPRLYLLFTLKQKVFKNGAVVMKPAWSGAFYFLLTYIMLSQIVGALYYLQYIELLLKCKAIVHRKKRTTSNSGWDELFKECGMDDQIKQGLFSDIHKNNIGSRSLMQRYMYCFSWGLKCLSSMGQNFDTNASAMETSFSFLLTISGLVLFAGLIAQMQTCIQSMEPGEEQLMVRQREVEEWAKNHQIPPALTKRLRQTVGSDWRALRGLDDETVLSLLPSNLQYDIRRHLYFDLVCNFPFFGKLDREIANSFCGFLRTFSCSADTYVIIEGEPIKYILFIFSGQLEISSIDGGSPVSTLLEAGDLCGSELLAWASLPSPSNQNLPSSCQSVKCLTNVEAFSLFAEDLKLLAIQFKSCLKFQQILKYDSQ